MKNILINIAVFAVGATAGFLVAKKMLEDRYAEFAQQEIDSVKEAFGKYHPNRKKDVDEINKDYAPAKPPEATLVRSSLNENKYEQAKRNYNLIGKSSIEEEIDNIIDDVDEVRDAAGKTEEEMDLSKVDRTKPYIITDTEFNEEFDHHDKCSLYYYSADDVLSDEGEDIIDNVENLVGLDAIDALNETNIIWVRNEPLAIDYEIIVVNGSFAEIVHGVGIEPNMTPRERYLAKQRRIDDE